ncbi:hypothetical protein L249_4958 [Ophiocordyceps polyrhachis-furcata BCC 54312]|uniref:Uncharacterized protein n=1 Tax=Ophiocordyceps polyrhachis-furcata BCC 54312 TaxID=1330021 RepID=A0A367L3P3_9HYPO|nr:hypothetical protein L249_4958 [Ophiocordyceps polyrhachis-furcata BCC 54312]
MYHDGLAVVLSRICEGNGDNGVTMGLSYNVATKKAERTSMLGVVTGLFVRGKRRVSPIFELTKVGSCQGQMWRPNSGGKEATLSRGPCSPFEGDKQVESHEEVSPKAEDVIRTFFLEEEEEEEEEEVVVVVVGYLKGWLCRMAKTIGSEEAVDLQEQLFPSIKGESFNYP